MFILILNGVPLHKLNLPGVNTLSLSFSFERTALESALKGASSCLFLKRQHGVSTAIN
jgi:hypothetical protein